MRKTIVAAACLCAFSSMASATQQANSVGMCSFLGYDDDSYYCLDKVRGHRGHQAVGYETVRLRRHSNGGTILEESFVISTTIVKDETLAPPGYDVPQEPRIDVDKVLAERGVVRELPSDRFGDEEFVFKKDGIYLLADGKEWLCQQREGRGYPYHQLAESRKAEMLKVVEVFVGKKYLYLRMRYTDYTELLDRDDLFTDDRLPGDVETFVEWIMVLYRPF